MPKIPRDLSQDQATRAFVRSGGVVNPSRGKGSHRAILMPNGNLVILPMRIKVGLVASQIRDSGMTVEEFINNL